jgi:hypothetical protein
MDRAEARWDDKKNRRGGMLGLPYLGQGSGVTPGSDETALRSRLGRNYRQLPASKLVARACPLPKSCANRIWRAAEPDLAAATLFLNRRLSFGRLLWVDW